MKKSVLFVSLISIFATPFVQAEMRLAHIFSDHMVLQRDQPNRVWGWDDPELPITVTMAGKDYYGATGEDGFWEVTLDPLPATATPLTLVAQGSTEAIVSDILVGDVWICSGQSNMKFPLKQDNSGDFEKFAISRPTLRLLTVPLVSSQTPRDDIDAVWQLSSPEELGDFSAIGAYFGRILQDIVGVPIGLIDNAWGGAAAEAWMPRDLLESDPRFADVMERAVEEETRALDPEVQKQTDLEVAAWLKERDQARAEGKPYRRKPWNAKSWLEGNKRPGNIYNGVLRPTIGYGIKGVIWYQGEANAIHAWDYRALFPALIQQWRQDWGQGDFPFYWVQLADYTPEKPHPGDSAWAELREAQTLAMSLPHTGQAVAIDRGEGRDVHPRDKYTVATRLVRWALVKDYGFDVHFRSPEFKSLTIKDSDAVVTIDCFGDKLRTFDVDDVRGFAICGKDQVWHWADARITGAQEVTVSSPDVSEPVAVRYAWANNPVCNLYANNNLPVTPFRTDNFKLSTEPAPDGEPSKTP